MDQPFKINVKYVNRPAYIGCGFSNKTEWLVYAETDDKAIDKLDKHLRSFLVDIPKVGDPMMLYSATLLV